jgi:hypothetical protein
VQRDDSLSNPTKTRAYLACACVITPSRRSRR